MPDPVPPVPPVQPPPPPVGLVNVTPGQQTTTPGTSPSLAPPPGSPVTGYNPATATAAKADTSGFAAKPYEVAPNATVASQLKGIIDAGSPLFEQAEANARAMMNRRGLINSSQAITAGQSAVLDKAVPIATSDAATFNQAATNTVNAQNRAAEVGATAGMANAAAETQTSQFNAGQQNAALEKAAAASNTVGLTAQQGEINKELQRIQADTTLSVADKQAATQSAIAQLQAATQERIAQLQSQTELTAQDKAVAGQQALAALNNASQQAIAHIQADTSLSIADKQAAIQRLTTSMNNDTAKQVQELQNAGSLANIRANGEITTRIQVLGDQNKLLLQTNAGASQIYTQALTNMSAIQTNPNLNPEQKTQALNNQVAQLTDALQAMSSISGTPGVSSLLTFNTSGNDQGGGFPAPNPTAPADNATAQQAPAVQRLYATVLGRPADAAGLDYWAQQVANGMPLAQVEASMRASAEYQALHPGG